MSNRSAYQLTPTLLLRAYAMGIFPMAENADATELHWYDPPVRALIPLDERFHISRRLKRQLRDTSLTVTVNKNFTEVMRACAEPADGRATTWINGEIVHLYTLLHRRGNAHSIEVWNQNDLVGGLYGVSLGGAFFGESMFSRQTNTSKIALVHLVALLRSATYTLLDTQFLTEHLSQFGTFEIARSAYHLLLAAAVGKETLPITPDPNWDYLVDELLSLQPVSQIS